MADIEQLVELLAPEARMLLVAARLEARSRACFFVGVEHFFVAIVKSPTGALDGALKAAGFDPKSARDAVRRFAGGGSADGAFALPSQITIRLLAIGRIATSRARERGEEGASELDLIRAIFEDRDASPRIVLGEASANLDEILKNMESPAQQPVAAVRQDTAEFDTKSILARYGRDLSALASRGELRHAIGRDSEVREVLRALCRQTKNAPLLIGDPGVGKTAIVEELAYQICEASVPEILKGKRIIEISLSSLVAGTKYRGEFEERMNALVKEARENKDVLLFIDEIHSLVGAGRAEGAPLDAGDILKPALARGEIRVIGATTPRDYAQSIEKDGALARRFQVVRIEEPNADDAKKILEGRRASLEAHHGFRILDNAIEAAVEMSVRYLPELRLPDKAIDLLDEACVRLRVRSFVGKSVEEVDAAIVAEALSAKTGIPVNRLSEDDQNRLLNLEGVLKAHVIGQDHACAAVAAKVRLARAGLRDPKKPVGVFFFVGPSGVGKTELSKVLSREMGEGDLIRVDMSEFQESHSISRLIGSPPGYVGSNEEGQLTRELRRHPSSVVLFDEIEKAHPDIWQLFLQVFDDGRLTDSAGRHIDCRHAVFIMTSNAGSGLWKKERSSLGFGGGESSPGDDMRTPALQEVIEHLKKLFAPEFLNRIDEFVLFNPLGERELIEIARLEISDLIGRVRDKGIHLSISDEALLEVAKRGWDPMQGARRIERAVEDHIAHPLSTMILEGAVVAGKIVDINARDGMIVFDVASPGGDA